MKRTQRWLLGVAMVGAAAGAVAASLFWLVLTRSVAMAEFFGHVL